MHTITVTDSKVVIDDVDSKEDIGELAKVATFLGYDVHIVQPEEGQNIRMILSLAKRMSGTHEALNLVFLQGMASGKSPDAVIDGMRKIAGRIHLVMDKPYADTRGAGQGHVPGE